MDMTGEHRVPAPRNVVWEALNDPEALKQSIPGCEEITKDSDTSFSATVAAKVGPVKAKFSGAVTLSDIDPPNGYTISGEGKGGAAGFARGGAKVRLTEEGPNETLLSYEVDAKVGGKLAQIGSRLIDSTAKKMAGEFFNNFSEVVQARMAAGGAPAAGDAPPAPVAEPAPASAAAEAPAADPPAAEPPTAEPPAAQPAPARPTAPPIPEEASTSSKGINPWIWVAALAAIIVILLVVFGGRS